MLKTFCPIAIAAALLAAPFAHAEEIDAVVKDFTRRYACGVLWFQKNHIYHTNKYCFHTAHGLRIFGNENCLHERGDDAFLSSSDRKIMTTIRNAETEAQCPLTQE